MKKGILVKSKTTTNAFLFTKGDHCVGVVINGEWREMRNYFNYPMDLITLKKSISCHRIVVAFPAFCVTILLKHRRAVRRVFMKRKLIVSLLLIVVLSIVAGVGRSLTVPSRLGRTAAPGEGD